MNKRIEIGNSKNNAKRFFNNTAGDFSTFYVITDN